MTGRDLFDADFLRQLELLVIRAKRILRGEFVSRHADWRKSTTAEFLDHRSYAPGDDLRYLDWNVYGRLGTLFLKRFSTEENISVKIFLDCSASMADGEPSKFDAARRLAACLAYIGGTQFDRAEIIPFAGGGRLRAFTLSAKPGLTPMLEYLRALPCAGASRFRDEFAVPLPPERGRRVGFLLSDFLGESGYEQAIYRLQVQRISLCGVHLVDAAEAQPEAAGDLRLRDRETGEEILATVSRATMARYREAVQVFYAEVERLFRRREAGYLRVQNRASLEEATLLALRDSGMLAGARL